LLDVEGQTAAHVHAGSLLASGGVLFTLPLGNFSGVELSLTPQQVVDARNGDMYINVHTAANAAGRVSHVVSPCL
jgi:hypothetical protein